MNGEIGKVEITAQNHTETADFLPGDKVLCVDTNWVNGDEHAMPHSPILGTTYCVKSVHTWRDGRTALRLISIWSPGGYYAYHFRRIHR